MLRIVIIILILAHGVGHSMGLFPAFGLASRAGWSPSAGDSWLLTGRLRPAAPGLGVVLWIAALLGFVACGLGLLGWVVPWSWAVGSGVAAALVSLVALGLFPRAFPALTSTVGAVAVDLAVLLAVVSGWATPERFGL